MRGYTTPLAEALIFLGKILFPSFCVSCGKETPGVPDNRAWLCPECETRVAPFPHSVCPSCTVRTLEARLDDSCREKTALTRFFCAYPLKQREIQALLYTYKYRHAAALAPHMARMFNFWLESQKFAEYFQPSHTYIVVPVPLHSTRFRERGFNQAELLAQHIAWQLDLPIALAALARIKKTSSQLKAQSREERAKNMRDAFRVARPEEIAGKKIVLVDDVYTTGATMHACAQALRAAGAREVWGIAFARG